MNLILNDRLSQFMTHFQVNLWGWQQQDPLELTPKLIDVIKVLEFVNIERFVPSSQGFVGRPTEYRSQIARAFVAKAVLDLPTTEALIDRLQSDISLRRICGFQSRYDVPGSWTFSRAFAEFSQLNLPDMVHNMLIRRELGDQIIGHLLHDSTAIEAREQPVSKPKPEPKEKRKRGRPRKGEERPPEPETVLEKQQHQTLEEMRSEIPKACDVGCKKNSQGYKETWVGYKLHISTADGDIPIAAILSSASTHDSQVALPLMKLCDQRVTSLYDLADSAYCSRIVREESRKLGHVPLIDHNPRRGEKIEFLPHEAERYKARTGVERSNSTLKDNRGGRHVRVRGDLKVYAHLMYGILVIAAEQLLRRLN
jgi:Transposase DDE domain/Transposase domain (DUF772)